MKQVICLLFVVLLFCQLYALANAAPQGLFSPGMVNDDMTIESMSLLETGRFNGKVALVIGAASGIGKDMVPDLVRKGLQVLALAHRIDILKT